MVDMSSHYLRAQMLAPEAPPTSTSGIGHWVRTNLFATPKDAVLTIIALLVLAWLVPDAINWLFIKAVWTGADRTVCATTEQLGGIQPAGWSGACWAFVQSRFSMFIFGRYPMEERWRPILVGIMLIALLVPMLIPKVPRKGLNAVLLFIVFPVVAFYLLLGGVFGLSHVETANWGGLMVTLILSFVGIAVRCRRAFCWRSAGARRCR